MIIAAPSGQILLGNDQVAQLWRRSLLPANGLEGYTTWLGFHPDGRPYAPDDWPLVRSLRSGEVLKDVEIAILRGDGTSGTISVSSTPIRDPDGAIVAGVSILRDVIERRQAEKELRTLSQRPLEVQEHERRQLTRELIVLSVMSSNVYRQIAILAGTTDVVWKDAVASDLLPLLVRLQHAKAAAEPQP